ncbi:MAG: hypothetical protein IKM46_00185 [Clostridia bacterium]|nr:hypothetical protein [Clostridia bacterium]
MSIVICGSEFEAARDAWAKAFQRTREVVSAVNEVGEKIESKGDVVYSGNGRKSPTASNNYFVEDKYFKSQMAKWEDLKHGSFVKVGEIGSEHPLHAVGMPTGVLRFDVDKLKRNMSDHGDYLTVDLLKAIPEIIANPIAISEYSAENTVSVFGDIFVGKSPMMVGVTISKDRAGNNISKVRTYNTRRDVGNLINDETVLYLDKNKKRTLNWFQACGIQVPLGGTKFGFIRSISYIFAKINRKLLIELPYHKKKKLCRSPMLKKPTKRPKRPLQLLLLTIEYRKTHLLSTVTLELNNLLIL